MGLLFSCEPGTAKVYLKKMKKKKKKKTKQNIGE